MSGLDDFLNFWNSVTRDASNQDIKKGRAFSQTDLAKMEFDLKASREEREWQLDSWERTQSIPAQVQQMKDAGLNPALLYQGGASAGASSPASGTDVSAPDSQQNPMAGMEIAQAVMSMLTGTASVGSQIGEAVGRTRQALTQSRVNVATVNNTNADTALKDQQRLNLITDNDMKKIDLSYRKVEKELQNQESASRIAKNFQDIKESISRIDLNNSVIEVNGQKISLMVKMEDEIDSKIVLNAAKTVGQNLDNAKAATLLPYVERIARADLEIKAASANNLRSQTHLNYSESAVALADAAYKQGLLDKGQLDIIIEGMKIDNRSKETNRKVAVANAVVGNLCNIVNAGCNIAGTVMTGGLAQPIVNGATGQSLVSSTGVPLVR